MPTEPNLAETITELTDALNQQTRVAIALTEMIRKLVALRDPKVDAILCEHEVVVRAPGGEQLFPRDKESPAK